jgi:hypothetical protein
MLFKTRRQQSVGSINQTTSQKSFEITVAPEDISLLGADSVLFETNGKRYEVKYLRGKVKEVETEAFAELRVLNSTSDCELMM